jgi:hypothetical protein
VSRLLDDARNGGAPGERLSTVPVSWIAMASSTRRRGSMSAPSITGRSHVATKDKNSKKSMEKKRPQMSLKEKRQAKREKK